MAHTESPPKLKRLIFDVPPELHRQVKVRAAERGMTMRSFVMRLLEREGITDSAA